MVSEPHILKVINFFCEIVQSIRAPVNSTQYLWVRFPLLLDKVCGTGTLLPWWHITHQEVGGSCIWGIHCAHQVHKNTDMSGGTGCVCSIPILSMTYQVCCCDHRLYQSHSDNANEHILTMVHAPLLTVLLVVYQYMSVSYIALPENGLTNILSNKYHRGDAPWQRVLSG